MRTNNIKHYIEILPASLLTQRGSWERVANSLPTGGCLLVMDPENRKQTELMRGVARVLREDGREVVVWELGEGLVTNGETDVL